MAVRVSSADFIGRSRELAALEAALDRATAGASSSVLIGGDAGIGKSRLLAEFEGRAAERGARVLVGECVDLAGGELPYGPLVAALRPLVGGGEDGPLGAVPAAIRGPLGRLWPLARTDAPDADLGQGQLFEAVHWLLAAAAAQTPVVLVVEDLHWADRSSRDLLTFLLRNTRSDRVLFVGSYRSDELHRRHPLHPFVSELERSRGAERIELAPLAPAEVAAQLAGILGERPSPALARRLAERSEGNPFFAEELLAAADEGPMPESLRDVLLMRVERLSPDARSVLSLLAAAGRTAGHGLLAAAGTGDIGAAVREAIDQRVIVTAPNGADYAFRHTLMRDAVYADLLPGERVELHAALARAIEADPSVATTSAVTELAHHAHAAGDAERGLTASLDAAAAAEAVHAYAEAQLNLERALELWARVPADRRGVATEPEVLVRTARVAALAGDLRRAIALESKALRDAPDAPQRALSHSRLARYLWESGAGDEALEHYGTAVDLVPASPPTSERAQVLASLAHVELLSGELSRAREHGFEALDMARRTDARRIEASVLNTLAPALVGAEGELQSLEAVRRAREIAEEIGAADEIGRSFINECETLDQLGRLREAVAVGRRGIARARELGGTRAWGAFLAADLADRLARLGEWDDALAAAREIAESGHTDLNAGGAHAVIGRIAAERGQVDAARAELDAAMRLSGRVGGAMWLGPIYAASVVAELAAGDREAALDVATRGLEEIGGFEYVIYTVELYALAVRLHADGDDEGRARATVARYDAVVREFPDSRHVAEALVRRAEMGAELGDGGWDDVAARWDELDRPVPAAHARLRAAEALVRAGTRGAEVEARVTAAHATAERLSAAPLLTALDTLARRARLSGAPRERVESELGLTPREHEVLELVAAGRTNREIGETLFMSEKTASVHVSRILQKLGAANRAEAAGMAHSLGLGTQGGP